MNREELDLVTADVEANEKLAAAKEAYRGDPTPANKKKLADAKAEIFALRAHWRTIREAFNPDATVPTVAIKKKASI